MTTQPALFGQPLPTLPGMTTGVVAINGRGRGSTTLQCGDCYALETPDVLVLMTFKFLRCANDPGPVRRCPDCTTTHLQTCGDDMHKTRRTP
ncbi:hypothetical protein [Glutamicibacter sp. V16R2B1]|uniref:hypothetical protein n=1 Tax=Glutamicibacter sp. V16R2B1 TaxID=2036207 RepID=UPI0010FEA319|nr:hypothetical protein [Glutamicibacter sp. V16R2B1]TLK56295.1 hypothetical protein FDN03_02260 [Glutamicibacter sp. V16R2B1]